MKKVPEFFGYKTFRGAIAPLATPPHLLRLWILDFVSRDYAQYAWSLGTLSRRLAFFNVKYIDYNTDLNVVQDAGQFLGYRSMQRKIREEHNLAVPRNLVYDMMAGLDQEGLDRRGDVGKKGKERKCWYFYIHGEYEWVIKVVG